MGVKGLAFLLLLGSGALPGTLGPLRTTGVGFLRLAAFGGSLLGLLRLTALGGKASGWKPAPLGVGVVILRGLPLLLGGGLLSLNSSEEEMEEPLSLFLPKNL